MTLTKVMLIRHAEKPSETTQGVNEAGRPDADQLSVRGWQRAGALVRFFAPIGQSHRIGIATPTAIFACKPHNTTRSLRPFHTVLPLATALGITVHHEFARSDDALLFDAVLGVSGAALICWPHAPIPGIARKIAGDLPASPINGRQNASIWCGYSTASTMGGAFRRSIRCSCRGTSCRLDTAGIALACA